MTTQETNTEPQPWRVRSDTDPMALGGAVLEALKQAPQVHLRAIGAGAINQATKAIAIAVRDARRQNISLVCVPSFEDLKMEGGERTAMRFVVGPR